MSERAAGDLHAGRIGRHAGHRQTAVVAAVGLELVSRDDPGLDQRGIERDRVVADREQEAVAPLPCRILRAVAHRVEIGDRQHVGDAERLRDIALTLHFAHPERVAADTIGAFAQGGSLARVVRASMLRFSLGLHDGRREARGQRESACRH